MKKILLFAVLFLAVSVSSFAVGGKKKDNKKKTNGTEQPVKLLTSSDSTSYAAGYAATEGLLQYLTQRLNVDTAHIADFIRGFREAASKAKNPAYTAYIAGSTIAAQASGQILPNVSRDLVGTDDSIAAVPFYEGFIAGVKQDTTVFKMEKARNRFEAKATQARETRNRIYKKENEEWLANNKTKPGVVTLPSGLQYKVLKEGNGPKPKASDEVEVIYEGKSINGKVFDATKNHGGRKTDTFRCDQVIKGWTEALTSMNVGSKWEIYIPQDLAYGSREAGEIKPYSTLIFTVELVGIKTPEAKPATETKTTTDSKNAPAKGKTTANASKSNKKGAKKK
jgi:FKBP-type peptidyl-prolyl cis-trans isomerase FklB